ncbi:arsenate reductase [Amphibiibacter pelophylacis]|uniref:Arsenate reductase n=1 Tax=Amphibiibacter pelophylacis TaxID=1799477 RepID=A0ACC6NYM2_9BURK
MSPSPIRLYGIPNCDTVKKARKALADAGHEVVFIDVKKQALDAPTLKGWMQTLGWEALVNRRGTTWRGLSAAQQGAVVDAASACVALQENPSLMKRPVVEWPDGAVTVGYDAPAWAPRLQARA